jgi:hypothetical protein
MVDYINTFYVYTASISKFLSKYYTMITIDEYVRVFESRIGPLRLIPDKNEFIAEYIKVGLQHPEFISRTICNGSAIVIRSLIAQDILNILSPARYIIKVSGRKINVSLVELSVFPGYSPLFSLLQETAGFNVSDHLGVIKFAMLKNCGYKWLMEHDSLNNVNTRLELRETLKEWATLPEFKKSYNSKRINKCIRTNNEKLGEIVPYKKARVDSDQDE